MEAPTHQSRRRPPVTAVYLTMFFIILVALAIGGVVAIGMQGAGRERAPQLANHLAEAARRGRSAHVVPAPGLRFDLDTESDWLVYNGYLVGVGEE